MGLLVGYVLGVVPFASWHLIVSMTDGFRNRDHLWAAISIGLGKYALIGVGLWFLITHDLINLYGFLAGTFTIVPVLVILGSIKPKAEEGKES